MIITKIVKKFQERCKCGSGVFNKLHFFKIDFWCQLCNDIWARNDKQLKYHEK